MTDLTAGRRIQRGFRRVGIVLSVPLFLTAAIFGGLAGWQKWSAPKPVTDPWLLQQLNSGSSAGPPPGYVLDRFDPAQKAMENLVIALFFAAGGAAVLVFFVATGWTVAGFARD